MAICEKCKSNNLIESENGNYCCNCGWDSVKKDYIKKQTNADCIRAMSDLELSNFIKSVHNDGTCREYAVENEPTHCSIIGGKCPEKTDGERTYCNYYCQLYTVYHDFKRRSEEG